ncbi:GmrSD restriction endonuclease domain-containing protein [Mycoplasma sp. 4044]
MIRKNNLEYWTIGTNVSSYLNTIFKTWIDNQKIRKHLLEEPCDFTIIYENIENNDCELYFYDKLENCFVYQNKKIHKNSTITQFLRTLIFAKLIVIKKEKGDKGEYVEFSLSEEAIEIVKSHARDQNYDILIMELKKYVYKKTMDQMLDLVKTKDFFDLQSRKWYDNQKNNFFYSLIFTIVYEKSDANKKKRLENILKSKDKIKSLGYFKFISEYKELFTNNDKVIHDFEGHVKIFKQWLYDYHNLDISSDSIQTTITTYFDKLSRDNKVWNFKDPKKERKNDCNFSVQIVNIQKYFEILFLNNPENKFSVFIPHFQRGYAWNKELIQRLIKDIFELVDSENEEKTLDLGFISLYQEKLNSTYWLIDGQQRTMTLLIICYWIIVSLAVSTKNNDLEINGWDTLTKLFKPKANDKSEITSFYVLDKFEDLKQIECYKNLKDFFLNPEKYKNEEPKEFFETKELIESELNAYIVEDRPKALAKFVDYLFNNVFVTIKVMYKQEDVYKVFESVNTLSKPLQTYEVFFSKLYSLYVTYYLDKNDAEKKYQDFKSEIDLKGNNKNILDHVLYISKLTNYKKSKTEKLNIYNVGKYVEEIIKFQSKNGVFGSHSQEPMENLEEKLKIEFWRIRYIKYGIFNSPGIYGYEKTNQLKYIYTLMISKVNGIFKQTEPTGNLLDVTINLIYVILDKFGVFNEECLKQNEIRELKIWLLTLEKILIWWKADGNFGGESQGAKFDKIAVDILEYDEHNSQYKINDQKTLKNRLIEAIANIKDENDFDKDFNKVIENGLNKWRNENTDNKNAWNKIYSKIWHKLILEHIYQNNINSSTTSIDEVDTIYNKIDYKINKRTNKANEVSLEHCHPQKPKEGTEFFKNNEDKKYLHSIGNTCLLMKKVNSSLSNQPFNSKINKYPVDSIHYSRNAMKFSNVEIQSIDYLNQSNDKDIIKNIKDRQDNIIKALQEIYKGV